MNELQTVKDNGKAVTVTEDFKKIAIQWLTSTGNLQKFTESEKAQFCDICVAYGLNPIKKEVYGVKYKDKFNLIVGYESYIKRAERSGRLNGWECSVIGEKPDMKAVLTIYRKDFEKPFRHEVYFEEYNTGLNLWVTKPRTMLKKVAIAQGFRMCFSEELGGMPYTADELPDEMTHTQPVEEVEIAPTVKTTTTPKESAKKQKNIIANEPKENALNVEIVEDPREIVKDRYLTIKAYTPEEAAELGEIMNSKFSDGSPIFEADEKAYYRDLLLNGEFKKAIDQAKQEKSTREKNKVINGIAETFGGSVETDNSPLF